MCRVCGVEWEVAKDSYIRGHCRHNRKKPMLLDRYQGTASC